MVHNIYCHHFVFVSCNFVHVLIDCYFCVGFVLQIIVLCIRNQRVTSENMQNFMKSSYSASVFVLWYAFITAVLYHQVASLQISCVDISVQISLCRYLGYLWVDIFEQMYCRYCQVDISGQISLSGYLGQISLSGHYSQTSLSRYIQVYSSGQIYLIRYLGQISGQTTSLGRYLGWLSLGRYTCGYIFLDRYLGWIFDTIFLGRYLGGALNKYSE